MERVGHLSAILQRRISGDRTNEDTVRHFSEHSRRMWRAYGGMEVDRMGGMIPFAGGLVAMLAQIAVNPNSTFPNLCASGAIAAVMDAFLVTSPRDQIRAVLIVSCSRVSPSSRPRFSLGSDFSPRSLTPVRWQQSRRRCGLRSSRCLGRLWSFTPRLF
jgi:hypothetical protein